MIQKLDTPYHSLMLHTVNILNVECKMILIISYNIMLLSMNNVSQNKKLKKNYFTYCCSNFYFYQLKFYISIHDLCCYYLMLVFTTIFASSTTTASISPLELHNRFKLFLSGDGLKSNIYAIRRQGVCQIYF